MFLIIVLVVIESSTTSIRLYDKVSVVNNFGLEDAMAVLLKS